MEEDNSNVILEMEDTKSTQMPWVFEDVPTDIIKYFNIDIREMDSNLKDKVKFIFDYVKKDSKSMDEAILNISNIEKKVGYGQFGEERYHKVWNYIKVMSKIRTLKSIIGEE